MSKVTVVDSVMGSGKSSWAIQFMNESDPFERFIYITPINTEVDRIKDACPTLDFRSTNLDKYNGRKMHVVKEWLQDRANICSTHSLFRSADPEFMAYVRENNYTLILDEAMTVIEKADVKAADIETLYEAGNITYDEDGRVIWLKDHYDGRFADIKAYAMAGTLYHLSGQMFIRSFPPDAFQAFSRVYCLTYLFKAQQQRCFFDLHGIEYDMKSIGSRDDGTYTLMDYNPRAEDRAALYSLINVYDGPMNDVGKNRTALSFSWFRRASNLEARKKLQRAIRNYLMNQQRAKSSESLWTAKKDAFRVKDYDSAFAPINCRGTNEYADRWALAYAYNRFSNPEEVQFFKKYGIEVDEDMLAVSDLLQWIWRSRIRKGQQVSLYLPSSRMRSLLLAWSRNEI
jgi:hypothetical protein